MMSLWRDDAGRDIDKRMAHLLQKAGVTRWVWVVGDSNDDTEAILRQTAARHIDKDIAVVRHDTGIVGDDPKIRVKRLGMTANAGFDTVREDDLYWVMHESDLISSEDVVLRFLETKKVPIAGWPVLGNKFYDTWAYRADGMMFRNGAPYHPRYRDNELFEVDSVGSCWMFYAADLRTGVRCREMAVLDLCEQMKALGRRIWVDPRIVIEQPRELWTSRGHA